jgi:hypothetical protein
LIVRGFVHVTAQQRSAYRFAFSAVVWRKDRLFLLPW